MNTPASKTGLPDEIVFYCKDCHKVAPVHRLGRRYVYTCAVCGTKNVAFGSTRSIARYFRVSEEELMGTAEVPAEVPTEPTAEVPAPTPEMAEAPKPTA